MHEKPKSLRQISGDERDNLAIHYSVAYYCLRPQNPKDPRCNVKSVRIHGNNGHAQRAKFGITERFHTGGRFAA
ncbi:hypothetical protein WN55_11175 [Dufourea novaeangliae]|uniref:Uncharacterized protein n=1 Tax=Dufourea novaeangliae TaxID=178035 RepID=A0A154PC65_DUFNO|nr:hypothetical protein WN55_11175 [Dufourea novaeangliae]